jgi:hypothetical protein
VGSGSTLRYRCINSQSSLSLSVEPVCEPAFDLTAWLPKKWEKSPWSNNREQNLQWTNKFYFPSKFLPMRKLHRPSQVPPDPQNFITTEPQNLELNLAHRCNAPAIVELFRPDIKFLRAPPLPLDEASRLTNLHLVLKMTPNPKEDAPPSLCQLLPHEKYPTSFPVFNRARRARPCCKWCSVPRFRASTSELIMAPQSLSHAGESCASFIVRTTTKNLSNVWALLF